MQLEAIASTAVSLSSVNNWTQDEQDKIGKFSVISLCASKGILQLAWIRSQPKRAAAEVEN